MIRSTNRVVVLLILACMCSAAAAAPKAWHLLGERTVNDRAEYDTIRVGADEGRFSKLKLSVDDAPIEIKRVTIHYANGNKQTIERNLFVGEDRRSPTLDLTGRKRVIEKVVFYYEAVSRGFERASIKLYGRR